MVKVYIINSLKLKTLLVLK